MEPFEDYDPTDPVSAKIMADIWEAEREAVAKRRSNPEQYEDYYLDRW